MQPMRLADSTATSGSHGHDDRNWPRRAGRQRYGDPMSEMFTGAGPADDDARKPGQVPAFLEVEPGSFKPLGECSRSEVSSTIMSLTMQANALVDQAKALDRYLESRTD